MSERAIASLRESRVATAQRKRQAVHAAITAAMESNEPITISEIARRAGVSRQFLYSHSDLRAAVEVGSRTPVTQEPERQPTSGHVREGARSNNLVLAAKIERLRQTISTQANRIEDLEHQQQRWLGAQLDARNAVSPEDHAELRMACDRLMSENSTLRQQVAESRRVASILQCDLAASREAHRADLIEHGLVRNDVRPVAVVEGPGTVADSH